MDEKLVELYFSVKARLDKVDEVEPQRIGALAADIGERCSKETLMHSKEILNKCLEDVILPIQRTCDLEIGKLRSNEKNTLQFVLHSLKKHYGNELDKIEIKKDEIEIKALAQKYAC